MISISSCLPLGISWCGCGLSAWLPAVEVFSEDLFNPKLLVPPSFNKESLWKHHLLWVIWWPIIFVLKEVVKVNFHPSSLSNKWYQALPFLLLNSTSSALFWRLQYAQQFIAGAVSSCLALNLCSATFCGEEIRDYGGEMMFLFCFILFSFATNTQCLISPCSSFVCEILASALS